MLAGPSSMHTNSIIDCKRTQFIRSSRTGSVRVTLPGDIVQQRRQRYPNLDHGRQCATVTAQRQCGPPTLMFPCGNALSTSNASSLSLACKHCAWKRAGTTGSINELSNATSVLANAATNARRSASGPSNGNSSPVSRHCTSDPHSSQPMRTYHARDPTQTHLSDDVTQVSLCRVLEQGVLTGPPTSVNDEMLTTRCRGTYSGRNMRHQPIDQTHDFSWHVNGVLNRYCFLWGTESSDRSSQSGESLERIRKTRVLWKDTTCSLALAFFIYVVIRNKDKEVKALLGKTHGILRR